MSDSASVIFYCRTVTLVVVIAWEVYNATIWLFWVTAEDCIAVSLAFKLATSRLRVFTLVCIEVIDEPCVVCVLYREVIYVACVVAELSIVTILLVKLVSVVLAVVISVFSVATLPLTVVISLCRTATSLVSSATLSSKPLTLAVRPETFVVVVVYYCYSVVIWDACVLAELSIVTILPVKLVSLDLEVVISVFSVSTSLFSVVTSLFSVVTSLVKLLTLVVRDDMLVAAVVDCCYKVVICPVYVFCVVWSACCYVFNVLTAVMILFDVFVKVCTFVAVVCC